MKVNINAYYRLARLDKPAGALLLLIPCLWGLALAGSLDLYYYALFTLGAFTMRAAGCVINDIIDREFDSQVERTKSRPLASGEINLNGAMIFLAALLLLGFLVLIQLKIIAVFIALAAVPLFILYPFMKRMTYWPQAFLGLTFNIGVLVAYSAIRNDISIAPCLLYLGGICWTLGYDTIYAHQDKDDDILIGVKSTALKFGDRSRLYISFFYGLLLCLFATAIQFKFSFHPASAAAFLLATTHFAWQIRRLDINDSAKCMKLFKSNIYAGLALLLCLMLAAANL